MIVEVLISTMNNNNISELLKKMNIQTKAIVINQCEKVSEETIVYNNNIVKIYNVNTKGISASRNKALKEATGDILVIADDNEVLVDDYPNMILEEYRKNNADIITYKIIRENDDRKVKNTSKKIGYINAMRISSPQITFKRHSIEKSKIVFNEHFGTGEKYTMGEETIFLYNCIKNNLKIISSKKLLAIKSNNRKSTWYNGIDKEYLFSRGAAFYEMSNKFYKLFILQFAIRKRNLYKNNNIGIRQAIKYMDNGAKDYIEFLRRKSET